VPIFIVTTDGSLTEREEHVVLQDKDIIRITSSSFLVRNCPSAEKAMDKIAPTEKDKTRLKPWFVFQVSKPWLAQGAEQNYSLTHQKTIAFLKAYPEDTTNGDDGALAKLSDDELDLIANG